MKTRIVKVTILQRMARPICRLLEDHLDSEIVGGVMARKPSGRCIPASTARHRK